MGTKFFDNWVQQNEAANLTPEFYDTARQYRLAVEKNFNQERFSARSSANAATLQGQPQPEQKPKAGGQKGTGGNKANWALFLTDVMHKIWKRAFEPHKKGPSLK